MLARNKMLSEQEIRQLEWPKIKVNLEYQVFSHMTTMANHYRSNESIHNVCLEETKYLMK
jgi:hypothetical protein